MIEQAFVLAAGYGKRMKPITDSIPKPMIEVCGRSMLYRILDQLSEYGVKSIVINAHYKKDLLKQHIEEYASSSKYSVKIIVTEEEELLETGGGIINALQYLDRTKPLFVANSDSIFIGDNIFNTLEESWNNSMNILMLLIHKEKAIGYSGPGDFSLTNNSQICIKKNLEYVFSGIHIANPKIFEGFSISHIKTMDIYSHYVQDSVYQGFYGKIYNGQWFHVGTPEALRETEKSLQNLSQTP